MFSNIRLSTSDPIYPPNIRKVKRILKEIQQKSGVEVFSEFEDEVEDVVAK